MGITAPTSYLDMVDIISKIYDSDFATVYNALESTGMNNANDAFNFIKQKSPTLANLMTADGSVSAYTYTPTTIVPQPDASSFLNSNVQSSVSGSATVPINTVYTDPSAPLTGVDYQAGARTAASGSIGSTVKAVLDKAALGVVGVTLGAKAGAFIAQTFYDAAPYFWDNFAPTMNPATWSSIATTEGGKSFINMLFGIDNDKTTAYLPTEAVSYFMLLMKQQGFFDSSDVEYEPLETYTPKGSGWNLDRPNSINFPVYFSSGSTVLNGTRTSSDHKMWVASNADACFTSQAIWIWMSTDPNFSVTRTSIESGSISVLDIRTTEIDGVTYYYSAATSLAAWQSLDPAPLNRLGSPNSLTDPVKLFYNQTIPTTGGDLPEGITHQSGATIPSLSNDDTVAQADQKLRTQYPDWYQNPIYLPTQQPDGSIKDIEYIKVPSIPNPNNNDNPTNQTVTQDTDPEIDPNIAPQTLLETIFRYLNPNPPDTVPADPDTGDGESPAIITPTGNASSLWSVYNPTQAQINSFGAWLWSSNFIDQIAKLFLQPMDAIVGIHKVFATPIISGSSTIHCGYLDSEVPSAVVGNQYTYVDCGTVNLYEHFGNVFDYSPFTSVRLYLPFIGIVSLDVADVMRSSINVRYGVDVITGACLAMVKVTRDGDAGGVLYQYGGSCVVHYPHSSGSYMGIVSGVVGLAASAVSAIATGGVGAVVGGLNALSHVGNSHANYQIGGNFSGEPGAMGGKKPYLIISRPQPKVAAAVETFEGYPANYTASLNGATGFVKVLSCHVHTIKNATEDERTEIERHLKEGVVIA